MDAPYWLKVIDHMKKLGIDPDAATPEQVKQAIDNLGETE